MVKILPKNSDEEGRDFVWSFKPAYILLNIFGLNLQSSKHDQSLLRKTLVRIYCLSWFFVTMGCCFIEVNWMSAFQQSLVPDRSKASSFNFKFEGVEYIIFPIGVFSTSLVILPTKLTKFEDSIKKIGTEFAFPDEVYRRFRKCSFGVVAFSITLGIIFNIIMNQMFNWFEKNAMAPSIFTSIIAFWVYNILECAPLLTAILELNVAVTGYREINNEILVNSDQINNCTEESRPDTALKLKKWKSQHMLLYNNVAAWNDKMNWTLLIEICHIFFNFVIHSYYLLILISGNEIFRMMVLYSTTMVIKHMIMLFILCTSADILKCEANKISVLLGGIESSCALIQSKVDSLKIQFLFMVPEVKPFGFFNVGQPLLLTVLGTTLTYLIILYQYSSEGAV